MSRSMPLEDLLRHLRQEGFPAGPDDYLRVARVLACETAWAVSRLREVLACILVKDHARRPAFDRAMDLWFVGGAAPAEEPFDEAVFRAPIQRKKSPRHTSWAGSGRTVRRHTVRARRPRPSLFFGDLLRLVTRRPRLLLGLLLLVVSMVALSRLLTPALDKPMQTSRWIGWQETSSQPAPMAEKPAVPSGGSVPAEAPPAAPAPPEPSPSGTGWLGALGLAAVVAAALSLLLLSTALLVRARDRRRRTLFLRGPWTWTPPPVAPRTLASSQDVEDAAASLTWGVGGEITGDIDVDRTVHATIATGGFPRLVFRPPPPAPFCAVLVDDSPSARPWRPLVLDLFHRLQQAGVRLVQHDFHGQPEAGIVAPGHPGELHEVLAEADGLIVVGDAEAAWSLSENRPAPWIQALDHFPRRLWLNPVPRSRWSAGAHAVAQRTPMEQATLANLAALHGTTLADTDDEADPWAPVVDVAPSSGIALEVLRRHLGEAFPWLCRCAVAGEPDASTALWLETRFPGAWTETQRLRLLTLPWFVEGRWPAGLQARLVDALRVDNPRAEALVHGACIERLQSSPPPAGSMADLRWQVRKARHGVALGSREAARTLAEASDSPVDAEVEAALKTLRRSGKGGHAWDLAPTARARLDARALGNLDKAAGRVRRPHRLRHALLAASVLAGAASLALGTAAWKPWEPRETWEVRLTMEGALDALNSARFSPDGALVVTASQDGTVAVWDARTGSRLRGMAGHSAAVNSAAFSPDGSRIVTASSDRTAALWDAASGRRLATLTGHADWVRSAAFSSNGSRIVTAGDDNQAIVWDATAGRILGFLSPHSDWVRSAAFSPDGSRIITASDDASAVVWDAATFRKQVLLLGHSAPVTSATFSPDGRSVATTGWDATAALWDAGTGTRLAVLDEHSAPVTSAAFSPDGRRLVTGSDDGTAIIWDVATWSSLATLEGHSGWVRSVAFSPDGSAVVTASEDGTARIWKRTGFGDPPEAAGTTDVPGQDAGDAGYQEDVSPDDVADSGPGDAPPATDAPHTHGFARFGADGRPDKDRAPASAAVPVPDSPVEVDLEALEAMDGDPRKLPARQPAPQATPSEAKVTVKQAATVVSVPYDDTFEISGQLDRETVLRYIRARTAQLRWCHQRALKTQAPIEGSIVVSWIIMPTGKSVSPKVVENTTGSPGLAECILTKIATWQFPKPKAGGAVKVSYPFLFRVTD